MHDDKQEEIREGCLAKWQACFTFYQAQCVDYFKYLTVFEIPSIERHSCSSAFWPSNYSDVIHNLLGVSNFFKFEHS